MRYIVDHDIHIHSTLSLCSLDPEQTPEYILQYGKNNGYSYVCLTNHFWDEDVPGANPYYKPQNLAHLQEALPLPQDEKVHFYFGCEAEMDHAGNLAITKEHIDLFDFVIIPTTHLHMKGSTITEEDFGSEERRAVLYVERIRKLLSYDLPFHKIGLAHLTCDLIAGAHHLNDSRKRILNLIPEGDLKEVFTKAAEKGLGIEINVSDESFAGTDEDLLRPLRIAKACGCKFYFGSDAHHPAQFDHMKERCEQMVDLLGLEETDKFDPFHE